MRVLYSIKEMADMCFEGDTEITARILHNEGYPVEDKSKHILRITDIPGIVSRAWFRSIDNLSKELEKRGVAI